MDKGEDLVHHIEVPGRYDSQFINQAWQVSQAVKAGGRHMTGMDHILVPGEMSGPMNTMMIYKMSGAAPHEASPPQMEAWQLATSKDQIVGIQHQEPGKDWVPVAEDSDLPVEQRLVIRGAYEQLTGKDDYHIRLG